MADQGLVASATNTTNPNRTTVEGKPVDFTSQVQQLYRNVLNREGEQTGVDFWNKSLQSGDTIDDVRQKFLDSSEYKALNQKQDLLAEAKAYYTPSVGYTPKQWKVDAAQTVEGRLAGLNDPNSQLNKEAIAQSQQAAQRAGLRNSSLAATAGQKAVLDTSLPIASQDASTFANSAQFNTASENTALQFGANARNQANLQDAGSKTQLAIAGLNADTQKFVAGLNNKAQQDVANLDAKTKTELQKIVSSNSQLLQANTSAANAVTQYLSSVSAIQTSKDLDETAKRTAIENQLAALQESLRTFGGISGIDLSQYFKQTTGMTPPATPNNIAVGEDAYR